MQLTLADAIEAVGAAPLSIAGDDSALAGISTDSRTIAPGQLFVALMNEKADGHLFLAQAAQGGAVAAVVSRRVDGVSIPQVLVPDTEIAYQEIARAWREQFSGPVLAITGSVGKTTTKEMLAAALTPLGNIVRTEKSQNNETGVPKTLLRITEDTAAVVVEMGMRGSGQIARLCEAALPNAGAITAIAENHIELLGSMDAIADAKGELFAAIPADGAVVLNADEPYFDRLAGKTYARMVTVGVDREADFRAANVRATENGWEMDVNGVPVLVRSASRHDVRNALLALALAVEAGVTLADAAEALSTRYEPPAMRMQVERAGWGGTVLNDAYNAAPASVRSALETLVSFPGRKIAFLGDMKELGDVAISAHRELGQSIAALGGLDALITVGDLAAEIPGALRRFDTSQAAAQFAAQELALSAGDVVLVKGSRAMAMETIVQALLARSSEAATHG